MANSPYYIHRSSADDRWYIISDAIRDDCPIIDDFASEAAARKALAEIERERDELLGPNVPLPERGFGV